MATQAIIAYIPVLHKGYLQFLTKHPEVSELYLLSEDVLAEFPQLAKDIRALSAVQTQSALEALNIPQKIFVADATELEKMAQTDRELIMPDEDILHDIVAKYFPTKKITYDSVFLRWDKNKSLAEQEIEAHETVTHEQFAQDMMQRAADLAHKSADWWRQVGAVIIKDSQVLMETENRHVPSVQQPYFDGDPRGNFHKGEHIELSTAMHAEAGLIARAAKEGTSLEGAEIYVTTFPCPNCAKLIAYAGIRKLYFQEGYAMVDGQTILRARGVEIVRVESK